MKTLAINPGSTSTKIAVFEGLHEVFTKTIRHDVDELSQFPKIIDQYNFRKDIILSELKEVDCKIEEFDAIVGRGGLLKPIPGGVYKVNDDLIADLKKEILGEHASNLGGILAKEIASEIGPDVPSFIVDPVVVDEMDDLARISGRPELPRISIFHALNQKAVARRYARDHNKKYEDINLIVAHLGGGITVGAHQKGKVVDVNNGLDGDGPFSPERTGSLPIGAVVKLCYSRKYEIHEVKKMITGKGGMVAYLGSNNAYEIEKMIVQGNKEAELIYKAMCYQIAKEIASCAAVLCGKVDSIIITGGMAKSQMTIDWIKERVDFIAPVEVYPGEDEMQALSEAVYYAMKGDLEIKEYV